MSADAGEVSVQEIVARAAEELGFTYECSGTGWVMTGPDHQRLHLSTEHRMGRRFCVSGSYPHAGGWRYFGEDREITVAVSRGSSMLAREITRRLLPAYRRELAEALARVERHAQARAGRAALARRLDAAVAGGHRHENDDHLTIYLRPGPDTIKVTANYTGTGAHIDGDVSADQLFAIIEVLQQGGRASAVAAGTTPPQSDANPARQIGAVGLS